MTDIALTPVRNADTFSPHMSAAITTTTMTTAHEPCGPVV